MKLVNSSESDVRRLAQAGYGFYAAGALVVLVSPVFLGTATDTLSLDPGEIGLLASAEASGGVAASLTGPFWSQHVSWRPVAIAATSIMIAGILLAPLVDNFTTLIVLRLFTSVFGAGVLYALGIMILSQLPGPDRHYAIAGGAQALAPAIILFSSPALISSWGFAGLSGALALLFAVAMALAVRIPPRAVRKTAAPLLPKVPALKGLPVPGGWLLLSAFALTGATQAYWAFAERIGESQHVGTSAISAALGFSALIGIPAAIIAAVVAGKSDRRLLFSGGVLGFAIAVALLIVPATALSFALSATLLFFFSVFLTPFQLGALASLDTAHSAPLSGLVPAAQSFGVMAGPYIAGQLIHGSDFRMALWVTAVFLGVTWAAFLYGARGDTTGAGRTATATREEA